MAKTLLSLIGLVLALASVVLANDPETKLPGVVDLDPKNFDSVISGANVLVEFYAPWCGHCKRLVEDYGKLGEAVSASKSKNDFVIAKVNADKHKELGERFSVRGFPTIKFFPKGAEPEDYNGGRTVEDFVDFLNKKGARIRVAVAPSDVVTLTPSNFDSVVKNTDTARLVEFYAPWCGHCKRLAPIYEKLGSVYAGDKDIVVAKLDADAHRDLASPYDVTGFPTIKFFPKGSSEPEDYNEARELKDFVAFLNSKANGQRDETGKLLPTAGRVAALDELAKEYVGAENKDELLAKAKEVGAEAAYYVRVMSKILEKGAGFVTKEKTRLENILKSGSTTKERADEMQKKVNVLSAF